MISGEFTAYPIRDITINREARQRKTIDDIDSLAESLTKIGLIHPIVITREGVLVAGERRLTAATSLGWTHIPVQFTDELSAEDLHLIELEENVRRKNLTWQEEVEAVAAYAKFRKETIGPESLDVIAEDLGVSKQYLSESIILADNLSNPAIAAADKKSTARNLIKRDKARALASSLEAIDESPKPEVPLINADFIEWSETYTGPKFNLLHCDFPYGINANKQQQGSNIAMYGGYADSPDVYFELLRSLHKAMSNVVADHAHLIFWFSMDFYHETKAALSEMGWKVNAFPLIWHKSDNTGLLPDPNRGPRRTYETAFFATRGDHPIVRAVANSHAHPGADKSVHMSEKPRPMLEHFLRMVVDEHSRVLDPTAGSGNAIIVAKQLGAASVLGIERDPTFYERAKENYLDQNR